MVKVKRNFPSPEFIFNLIDWNFNPFGARSRKIEKCQTLDDIANLARKRVPKVVFDYVEGAALSEISVTRSSNAFDRIELTPKILKDVSHLETASLILGKSVDLPIIFAPTGYTRLMHHTGEIAACKVAKANNLIYSLSTVGTTSPEELAMAVPNSRRWFQLYLMKDREKSLELLNQAKQNGFEVLILTVDTPVPGIRPRDNRNGLTVPPRINLKSFLSVLRKPVWWFNLITTPPLEFAAFRGWDAQLFEMATKIFESAITYEDLIWLQSVWDGPIIVKGVQSVSDALELAKLKIEGIVISNHGGRQLDRSSVPLEHLSEIVNAVGDEMEIFIDGGILSGQDVYAAIALGAKGVLIGRGYLYGIMAGGEKGMSRVIEILRRDFLNTMALMGTSNIAEVRQSQVRLRSHN
jgi:isopentenyl diphosphate isomerase/L-lactate dehydrogenase-like FMN-dependent dehydrogenase